MFEDMWDDNDLEYTENRLRVHVLTLKKAGDPYPLFRLYGPLALALALRGKHLAAQDALNDLEFLLIEHGWKGTEKEAWAMCDRAKVMRAFGHQKFARRSLERARALVNESSEPELLEQLRMLSEQLATLPT